jgi:hypothetical protein
VFNPISHLLIKINRVNRKHQALAKTKMSSSRTTRTRPTVDKNIVTFMASAIIQPHNVKLLKKQCKEIKNKYSGKNNKNDEEKILNVQDTTHNPAQRKVTRKRTTFPTTMMYCWGNFPHSRPKTRL